MLTNGQNKYIPCAAGPCEGLARADKAAEKQMLSKQLYNDWW